MNEDNELLRKRFVELARASDEGLYYSFSDFLGLMELSVLKDALANSGLKYTLFGGAQGCERVIARFGDPEAIGYEQDFPIVCIKAEPLSMKFADKLSHRDFLGSLMNLGIERDTLGDIPIVDNIGYIFAKDTIAPFIIDSLTRIKHTDVKLSVVSELPEGELYRTEKRAVQLATERTDALISKVYNLSRDDGQALIKKSLVFINGRLVTSNSKLPRDGDVISVRGHGRFVYHGITGTSKKGKLNVCVEVYL